MLDGRISIVGSRWLALAPDASYRGKTEDYKKFFAPFSFKVFASFS